MGSLAAIYCKDCRISLGEIHDPDCTYFQDSLLVKNEHCGEPIVWEPSEAADSLADPAPLELHLSDHLDLGEKE